MKGIQTKILTIGVMVYLVFALTWWTILLNKKNKENFYLHQRTYELERLSGTNHLPKYNDVYALEQAYNRQSYMVYGESVFFAFSLMVGIFLIYRSYQRERSISDKQNNFMLSITHELKSPLTAMRMALDTLKRKPLEHNNVVAISDMALSENLRLEQLISDILMAAKVDFNTEIDLQPIELKSLVDEVVNRFKQLHPTIDIQYAVIGESAMMGDVNGIKSLINNLMENAIKYGNEAPIMVKLEERSNQIWFSVADFGQGIAEKEKGKIFDKFYRVGSEEVRKSQGTGLGLFIVKKIADLHKAYITVTQNTPRGTIFTVKFRKL